MLKKLITNNTTTALILEFLIILLVAFFFAGQLIDLDNNSLPQGGGEENQSAVRPILAAISLTKYHEIPLWNHYMQKGMPFAGDLHGHFWSPIATIPVVLWGGIAGMKISLFISFIIAGLCQWYLAHTVGVKGIFRVWSAVLFMCSGGMALLARLGWYELLVGIAWFPAAFASFWQALYKQDKLSIFWAAFCSAMILFTGGGYYPFYLFGCMLIIYVAAIFCAQHNKNRVMIRGAIVAAVLFGYIAIMTFPIYDSFRLIARDIQADLNQYSSQPIPYALFNYIVSDPKWFGTPVLGLVSGFTWFYIGPLVLAAWIFLPLALRRRVRTPFFVTMIFLFIFVLCWHSNRYTFFKHVYDWLPFLYNLRFPGRLLIVASSPLIVASTFMLQGGFSFLRTKLPENLLGLRIGQAEYKLNVRLIYTVSAVLLLANAFYQVFSVNKTMAFFPAEQLEPRAHQISQFIKEKDPAPNYVQFGNVEDPYWSYISVAMLYEMPVSNAFYGTFLKNTEMQTAEDAIFAAPKYVVHTTESPVPNGIFLKEFDGIGVWEMPDALPMAFTTSRENINNTVKLTNQNITPLGFHYDGPNRIIVQGIPEHPGDPLVILVSDYPGWKVSVNGQTLPISAVNGYMTVPMLAGNQTYTFIFDPALYKLGAAVTLITILVSLYFIFKEGRLLPRQWQLQEKQR